MFPVVNQTYATLDAAANPSSTTEPENFAHQFFDTQSITSGTTTLLNYFGGNQNTFQSNYPFNGMLPANQYFTIWSALATFLLAITDTQSATVPSATSGYFDLATVMFTQLAQYLLTINEKKYGPIPLYMVQSGGGITGAVSDAGQGTSGDVTQSTAPINGIIGNGWCYANNLVLQPMTRWAVTVSLAAAPTLTNTPLKVAVGMNGTYSRKVQ